MMQPYCSVWHPTALPENPYHYYYCIVVASPVLCCGVLRAYVSPGLLCRPRVDGISTRFEILIHLCSWRAKKYGSPERAVRYCGTYFARFATKIWTCRNGKFSWSNFLLVCFCSPSLSYVHSPSLESLF